MMVRRCGYPLHVLPICFLQGLVMELWRAVVAHDVGRWADIKSTADSGSVGDQDFSAALANTLLSAVTVRSPRWPLFLAQ